MPGFDQYFESKPNAPMHPKVRFWQQRMQDTGTRPVCELIRERDVLSFGPAMLYISFLDEHGNDVQSPDEIAWDSRLNDELLRLKVRAVTPKNESKRFGLVLRDRLAEPEERFGDGYFNAVLIQYIDESPFAQEPPIREKRPFIHAYQASRDGSSFEACRTEIEAIIVQCAHDLKALDYKQHQAVPILSGALAEYLDERFSITSRQHLGLT
jgi:hypothetical protein